MRKILYGEESKIKDNLKKYLFVEPIYGIIIVTQRRVQGGTAVELKRPEFIMFDYGQTLIKEGSYDGAAGFDRILRYALANPMCVTGARLQLRFCSVEWPGTGLNPVSL